MRVFGGAIVAFASALLVLMGAPAYAQREQAAVASVDAIARGLEAQYRAAIIRERRLADDRELRLIADAEARMRQARRALIAATRDRDAAQAALDDSRADFVRLVENVPLRDAATAIEIEAFRAEIEGRLPEATPDLMAAYQEFADGDRASAWITLEALLTARANARVAAARTIAGGEIRQLARLREIMRVQGEARATDVLALWDQAAALDPLHFWTHIHRARLRADLGRLPSAVEAVENALEVARSDDDRLIAFETAGDMAFEGGNLAAARLYHERAAAISRAAVDADASDGDARIDLTRSLQRLAQIARRAGDHAEALDLVRESIAILRSVRVLDARDTEAQQYLDSLLAVQLGELSDLLVSSGDAPAARQPMEEALSLASSVAAARSDDLNAQRDLFIALGGMAHLQAELGDTAAALQNHQTRIDLANRAVEADRDSWQAWLDYSTAYSGLADVERERGDITNAYLHYGNAAGIALGARRINPESAQAALAYCHAKLGVADMADQIGYDDYALRSYEDCAVVARSLVQRDAAGALAQSYLASALQALGDAATVRQDTATAWQYYREALPIFQRLAEADPANLNAQIRLANAMFFTLRYLGHETPAPSIRWRDYVELMERIERRRQLSMMDRLRLANARDYAAREESR